MSIITDCLRYVLFLDANQSRVSKCILELLSLFQGTDAFIPIQNHFNSSFGGNLSTPVVSLLVVFELGEGHSKLLSKFLQVCSDFASDPLENGD